MDDAPRRFWQACETTPRDRRNERRVILWTAAWMGTWLAINGAIRSEWLGSTGAAVGATLVFTALGLGVATSYRRFLRDADELLRKIELEALALAVGVGLVGGFTYWTLARAGVIPDADVLVVLVLMMVTHALAVFVGRRRYA